ncbi:hypothetical protein ACJRO7_030471 [Eucalyptus globulus]|uniref:Secreted protein n=1 Tax=Eucalyptus globulus TaxID=34317 RepID=A0ABD3JE08_EUCGL
MMMVLRWRAVVDGAASVVNWLRWTLKLDRRYWTTRWKNRGFVSVVLAARDKRWWTLQCEMAGGGTKMERKQASVFSYDERCTKRGSWIFLAQEDKNKA